MIFHFKLFWVFVSDMSDGRSCTVVLLDGTAVAVKVKVWWGGVRVQCQATLLGNELMSLVTSRFSLHEKDYFGLAWREDER